MVSASHQRGQLTCRVGWRRGEGARLERQGAAMPGRWERGGATGAPGSRAWVMLVGREMVGTRECGGGEGKWRGNRVSPNAN